jgi:uncharacterized membrane protein
MSERIKHSEVIDEPVEAVYERWRGFHRFPAIAEVGMSVMRTGPAHLRWCMNSAGNDATWEATIVDEVPGRRIAWRGNGQLKHSGQVEFEPQGAARALVTLEVEFETPRRNVDVGDEPGHSKRMIDLAAAELGAGEVRD